jgi:hypothetical protein
MAPGEPEALPAAAMTPDQHRQRLRWEIDVILTGLTIAGQPGA